MKDHHINVFYSEDDKGYIADIPDLPHCSAFGATPEEALREVLQAKEAWFGGRTRKRQTDPGAALSSAHLSSCVKHSSNSPTRSVRGLPRTTHGSGRGASGALWLGGPVCSQW